MFRQEEDNFRLCSQVMTDRGKKGKIEIQKF